MSVVPRHDMSGMDMNTDMEGMDMNTGGYDNFTLQTNFWIFIGSVIAFATFVNILDNILLYQRLRSKSAKPASLFWTAYATLTAIGRELFGASTATRLPVIAGPVSIIVAYAIVVIVFSFIGTAPSISWNWEDIAVRIGSIVQAQLPLVFLLAGKQNIIGWFTGLGYEKLNWLHRWIARIIWIGVTMHMGFFFRSWSRWDYVKVKLSTDNMTQTGFAGWCILTAIFFLSFAPVRRWNYELFIMSHIVLFAGFIGAVMIHVDSGAGYVWACVGLYLFDRFARFIIAVVCNIGFRKGKIWANHAILTPLPGNVTRITIDKPVVSWSPGQHMFLSCHTIVPLQSHPFTISSLPTDEKMEFLVQSRDGGTKRFHRWASKYERLSGHEVDQKLVGIEGPYGHLRPLRQFHSVVLLAGSTGITFTIPLMRDIIRRWELNTAVTTTIRFVWAIKSRDRMTWFQTQLEQAISDVALLQQKGLKVVLEISVYVTCDEELVATSSTPSTSESTEAAEAFQASLEKKDAITSIVEVADGCGPNGTCCCRSTVNDEKATTTPCCCKPSSSSSSIRAQNPLRILTGRPHLQNIIRKVLEEAEGESAVVVCGPTGLQRDVRRTVICLSDERAVHKGTGAQGIYLHVEGFGY